MPNWCENDLTLKGTPEDLNAFEEFAKNGERLISAHNFIPYPEEYRKQDELVVELRQKAEKGELSDEEATDAWKMKDGYNSGGYQWCVSHWGTKWDLCHVEQKEREDRKAFYTFVTAWSPPLPLIREMSRKFPKIQFTIKYYEGGNCFKGVMRVKDGEIMYESQSSYRGHRGG